MLSKYYNYFRELEQSDRLKFIAEATKSLSPKRKTERPTMDNKFYDMKIVEMIDKYAPKMPISDALNLAHECQEVKNELREVGEALAVLSSWLLTNDGKIPSRIKVARPAVRRGVLLVGAT